MRSRISRPAGVLAPADLSRRRFVQAMALGGVALGTGLWQSPAWALKSAGQPEVLSGSEFDLHVAESTANFTGRARRAVTINGTLPAPVLRFREGDSVTLRVHNSLSEDTSIHWHGLILPANMDGVPGLSFHGIRPGETFSYRFPVKQSGTYWYHSHSGLQEQVGLYGALIIEPREPEAFKVDRDYVVMLSDWTDENPHHLLANLKKQASYYNYQQRTVADFFRDVREQGLKAAWEDRRMWGGMRMTPTDLADVSAATYTYLINGQSPAGNWSGLFRPGEKVRLRFINGSAMTIFDVRIPGLKMTVVAADGQSIEPVIVDEFRIANAETYDVIVEAGSAEAYTIFAQSMDRTGFARATLAQRPGLSAAIPQPDKRVLLGMSDMGHGSMAGHDMSSHDMGSMDMSQMDHDMSGMNMSGMDHGAAMQQHPASEQNNPGVDMQAMSPVFSLADPGIGLRDNGRRVLSYADLKSAFPDPDGRAPTREIELHLTGHMERYMWSFNGIKFADAEPLRLRYGERVRITLVNDTMMEHPIHLHGMWSDLEDENGEFLVRKHTIRVPPGTKRSYRVSADALGRWAYHCHLLYHMEAGMFREVRVEAGEGAA